MNNISSLTLVLTERCNFSCFYCPQHRGKNTLQIDDINTFLDCLKPYLATDVWLNFFGGEPLLAWPLIADTVAAAQKIKGITFRFSITSNGSLLKKEHILFFKKNNLELAFSYDGKAQRQRDASSVAAVEAALASLQRLYPQGYMINSVFTPKTVSLLAASIGALIEQGHQHLEYALDLSIPWLDSDLRKLESELGHLAEFCLDHFQKSGRQPLENFQSKADSQGVFACFAGRDRLALLPDNTVWGCYLFYDLLGHLPEHPDYRKYCFGKLGDFSASFEKDFPIIAANYTELRQDYFFTAKQELCSLCPELEYCRVCPVVAALTTSRLGVIPDWICRVKQANAKSKAFFARLN
jgi:sulfatase maturation enzyme AslB (radical SAM superfamily)